MTRFAERARAARQEELRPKHAVPLWRRAFWAVGCVVVLASGVVWAARFAPVVASRQNCYTKQDGMPDLFYFGGKTWFIVADSSQRDGWDAYLDRQEADAVTECAERVVVVRSNLPRNVRMDVLLHELLHVGACGEGTADQQAQYYNSSSMADHPGFQHVAKVLSELFRENPELAGYVSGARQ